MDPLMLPLINADTPKLNPRLARGLATEQMRYTEPYLDDVFRSIAKDFPPGLVYAGCAPCTPEEEYNEVISRNSVRRTPKKNSRKNFETSRTDMYLMKYFFKLHGEPLETLYMYLPFVSEGGRITMSGSNFTISPVLSDKVVSIGAETIFIKLIRDKITLKRMLTGYMAYGVRESVQMVYSKIYKDPKAKPNVKAATCLVHYLFCKYGALETFQRFANCTPLFGEDFPAEQYPRDQWVVCTTEQQNGSKPRTLPSKEYYEPSRLKIAVRREDYTPMTQALIAGFYYVVDHFPPQMIAEYVNNPRQWVILLGKILLSSNANVGILYDKMINHIDSLDEYVDTIVRAQLREIGIDVTDIYEFFAVIVDKYTGWLLNGGQQINSMYDKELQILYYVLGDISEAIVRFYFRIKATSAKKELTAKEVENIIKSTLKHRLIFKINKKHGEITSVGYSGDNMAFKVTSSLIPQSKSKKGKTNDRGAITDPSKRLHVSVAEVGAYSGMPKSAPDGRTRINHCVMIDHKNNVVRNPKLQALLDDVQQRIKA